MPFTPPTTVASASNAGYLSQFLLGSPPTGIAEVKSFTLDLITMSEINVSTLLSPLNTEEFIPAMIKPGKCQVSGNFIGDATQLQFTTLAQAQTIFNFSVKAPVQRNTKTATWTMQGFISSYKPGPFENNKPIEFSAEIQLTGAYTESVA